MLPCSNRHHQRPFSWNSTQDWHLGGPDSSEDEDIDIDLEVSRIEKGNKELVLVVDDLKDMRDLISKSLESNNYQVAKASNGEIVVPVVSIWWYNLSYRSALLKQRQPAITSECPPIYLVIEWRTISAPSFNGFYKAGDMNVLSTTSNAPLSLHNFDKARMSMHLRVGFVGVSRYTIFVFGWNL